MRVMNGKNPFWADFDEIDIDAEDARESFCRGEITLDQLRSEVGTEEARRCVREMYGDDDCVLFYDPEFSFEDV